MKLPAVRKVVETNWFQPHGIFETLGSKISHGASKKIADVPTHLREVYKRNIFLKSPYGGFFVAYNLSKHSQARIIERC